ncbi:assembly factor cbp4, variant 2 [Orbilia oligospora]|uniref:Cytochrome b mRNA-processing protein 4 n=1 Tax=Orbilia oligospora TaxID=2813651 RepID=A0A7C8VFR8_ORBOL|nr:assembly factor cbp4, variant 2 [Orbilia oligospora]KAF3308331.1 assembly factor cbp4, variant 2 [Orbilia oligospora]
MYARIHDSLIDWLVGWLVGNFLELRCSSACYFDYQRYSPELQKKVLEERPRRQREMQEFFDQLKEYSKSDKPIWVLQEEDAKRRRKEAVRAELQRQREEAARRASMLSEQLEGQIPSTGL